MLFDLLARLPDVWTIGGESHVVHRQFPHLAAENAVFDSGKLDERHADPETVRMFRCLVLAMLRNRDGALLHDRPAHEASGTTAPLIVEKRRVMR